VERFVDIAAPLGTYAAPLTWGDYNNDGWVDLIAHNTIYRNDGNGGFVASLTLPAPVEGSVNWGDFDNDSDLDLLVTGSNASSVFRNLQAGPSPTLQRA
jgi:hypothetical protein